MGVMIGKDLKTERKRLNILYDFEDPFLFDGCCREIAGLDSARGLIGGVVDVVVFEDDVSQRSGDNGGVDVMFWAAIWAAEGCWIVNQEGYRLGKF